MKVNLRKSYKHFKEKFNLDIDIKTYLTLNAEYNKFLIDKVLQGHEITLPERMGTLSIVGKKQQVKLDEEGNVVGLAPDWVKTKELWRNNPEAKRLKKRVFHLNAHSDNTRYKFLWSKARVLVKNKNLYALRLTRDNKRAVHNLIKQGVQYKTI